MLEDYIRQLSEDYGVTSEKVSEKSYRLMVENGVLCEISQEKSSPILLRATVSACPERNLEDFLREIMRASLFGQQTGGATFSLDSSGEMLVLSLLMHPTLEYRTFYEKLEDFLNYVDYWKNKVIEYEKAQDTSPLR